jgi:hypothetical protein
MKEACIFLKRKKEGMEGRGKEREERRKEGVELNDSGST